VSGAPAGAAPCSVLVLGEDSAADAHQTLVAVAKKLFRLVDDGYDWQHVRFEPPQHESAQAALRGNLWKSKRPEDYRHRRDLIEFRSFIETDVRQFVEHRLRQSGRAERVPTLSQLLLMVPYYSIEAWLFQNTEAGRRLCRENGGCRGEHVPLFDRWEEDRASLDEEEKPKDQVCFKGRHNHRLAEGLDVDAVYYTERSLHAAVEDLLENEPLRSALASTRPT
jgi:hypothetical protein